MTDLPCAKLLHPAHAAILVCYCGREGCNAPAKPRRKPSVTTTHPNHPAAIAATRRLEKVVELHGDYCYLCGASPAESADHVFPRGLGGGNALDNLRPCCLRCNNAKADTPLALFLANRCRAYVNLKKATERINPLKEPENFDANFSALVEVTWALTHVAASTNWVVFHNDEFRVTHAALADGLWPEFLVWNGGDLHGQEERPATAGNRAVSARLSG